MGGDLRRVDCCVTPVLRLEESLDDAQIAARGMVLDVDGVRQFAPPVRLSEFELGDVAPAPAAGADSDAILSGLGLDAAEIARLRAAGVI